MQRQSHPEVRRWRGRPAQSITDHGVPTPHTTKNVSNLSRVLERITTAPSSALDGRKCCNDAGGPTPHARGAVDTGLTAKPASENGRCAARNLIVDAGQGSFGVSQSSRDEWSSREDALTRLRLALFCDRRGPANDLPVGITDEHIVTAHLLGEPMDFPRAQ